MGRRGTAHYRLLGDEFGDDGAADGLRLEVGAEMLGGGTVAHLENGGAETARALLGGLDEVEFGEGGAERFFAEDVGAGLHRGDGEGGVEIGRRADVDEVGLGGREQLGGGGKHGGPATGDGESRGAGVIDVVDTHEFDAVGVGEQAGGVLAGDVTGADDGGAKFGHFAEDGETEGGRDGGNGTFGSWAGRPCHFSEGKKLAVGEDGQFSKETREAPPV